MGQRHQIFLIFRGKCICALHHQWLYGRSAPTRLLRLLAYLQDYKVLRVIEHGDAYAPMISSYGVDSKLRYQYHPIREPDITDSPFNGDNNDGITIVSLEDVGERPKYCFMALRDNQFGSQNVIGLTPLTANEYMRAYYPEGKLKPEEAPQIEAEIADITAQTANYELLRASDLAKAWPHLAHKFQERPASMPIPPVPASSPTNPASSSLSALCVDKLLHASDPTTIASTPWTVLLPIVSAAITFSGKTHPLSTPALLSALSSLPADRRASFTEVNLASRRDVGDSELARVLELCPNLRRLDLSGTSVTNRCFSLLSGLSELLLVGCPVKHACDQGSWDTLAQQNPRLETLVHDFPFSKETAPQEEEDAYVEEVEKAPSPRATLIYLCFLDIFLNNYHMVDGKISLRHAWDHSRQNREGVRHFWLYGMRCVRMVRSCLEFFSNARVYSYGGLTVTDKVCSVDATQNDSFFQSPSVLADRMFGGRRDPSNRVALPDQGSWAVLLVTGSNGMSQYARYAFVHVQEAGEPEKEANESEPFSDQITIQGRQVRVRPVSVADYLEACYPSSADASWRAGLQHEEQEALQQDKAALIKSMEGFEKLTDDEAIFFFHSEKSSNTP